MSLLTEPVEKAWVRFLSPQIPDSSHPAFPQLRTPSPPAPSPVAATLVFAGLGGSVLCRDTTSSEKPSLTIQPKRETPPTPYQALVQPLRTHFLLEPGEILRHSGVSHLRSSLAVQWLGLCFHCRGYRFNPWLGNRDPPSHVVWPKIIKNFN